MLVPAGAAGSIAGHVVGQWGWTVPVFVGTHINRIDRKGRVSVPAAFRATLGETLNQGLYLMRSIRGVPALDGFGADFIARLADGITNPFASEDEDFTSAIFGASQQLSLDNEGRMMLPEALRAFAGIDDQVCFIGRGKYFQVWEPAAGQQAQEEAFRRATANRSSVSLRFAGPGEGGA